ncbi:hypothetical protein IKL45_00620 [Candidatus Saccharibacteria bacterium]|nr:hypothetical protein [Candidatus Saccharibacteria bacterium]MBR6122936.1 hypothetical protein [Candidatus Saccharibacteria bacterium]
MNTSGGRNLVLLGIGAILITFITTFVSLKIYHDSGDIYLDRSRPGFLPEKEEAESDKESADFKFPDSGDITNEVLDEYLNNLKQEIDRLNDFSDDPFGSAPLSNENLGF